MKLTGAAILVSRAMNVLQAASAAYPYRQAIGAGCRSIYDYRIRAKPVGVRKYPIHCD
jgi:hypothetical protein